MTTAALDLQPLRRVIRGLDWATASAEVRAIVANDKIVLRGGRSSTATPA